LAREVLDVFLATVAAAADEGVDLFIGDAVVEAVGVGTGKPSCRDPFLAAARAFYL
jgi:sulfur relay (sulfurtransferase) DsrF/TusC family protein